MSYVDFYCPGCGVHAGIAGDLSDDSEERWQELDEQYEFERMWDETHADCDARRRVRSGIVVALVAVGRPEVPSRPDHFHAALAEPRAARVSRRRDARLTERRIAGRAITARFVAGLTEALGPGGEAGPTTNFRK